MTDLKTTFAGLQLKNPIIISSSGLTNSAGKNKKLAEAGAGAIVLKSLFEIFQSSQVSTVIQIQNGLILQSRWKKPVRMHWKLISSQCNRTFNINMARLNNAILIF